MVGNDLVKSRPRLNIMSPLLGVEPVIALPPWRAIVLIMLFMLVAISGIEVGGRYWSAHLVQAKAIPAPVKDGIAGLNLSLPVAELQSKITAISSQPASLTVGSQTVPISPGAIKSWLRVTPSTDKTQDSIYVDSTAMTKSLNGLANQFVKTPVSQVTVTHNGIDQVVVAGRNGATLSDAGTLATQAQQLAKTVMNGKGLQFNTPLVSQPFQAVTPAAFPKLLEADVTTKTLYVYQNGQLINTFLTSDGAPATPTPLGEFHIYAKYAVQDMSGYNTNGTKYFQPRVPWVNYFAGADAIHGVYWHPLSWFGVHNSSHGCVGVPVNVGAWIYDWAPIGTTVITHA